jgi:hypothetical protein
MATSKFLPTIAEIRAAAVEMAHGARRLGGEAWGDVGSEIRRVGAYGEPQFTDPVAAECVRLMGWRNLCLGTNDAADRARFVELYDGLAVRARADQVAGEALALPKPQSQPVRALPAAWTPHQGGPAKLESTGRGMSPVGLALVGGQKRGANDR